MLYREGMIFEGLLELQFLGGIELGLDVGTDEHLIMATGEEGRHSGQRT